MKKMLVMAALAICSFANAQKGTILVGGNIGYTSEKSEFRFRDDKASTFTFSPKVGYQFHENWTVGGEFSLSTSDIDNTDVKRKDNKFRTGGFVRYTKSLSQTFSVFADMGVGFQTEKNKIYTNANNYVRYKGDGAYVDVTPALFINMKKGFGLNFSIGGLGYETLSFDDNGEDYSNFYFNFGKTFNIGISKNF
ncbi:MULTISPECIES: outer membrane beta-barrel protein [Flavobacterium]|uniref:Outer membrane beta-barrel protein n=1 Tax=Flavobacterium ginsengisoli TaxID=871694 RepID=A0ABP7EXT9_9FLAO|nr:MULTISPECIES: outer membrane beta-barrel protein [Flavobacterium]MBJ2123023.1 outer membrane beta-barrel protein [Flavobacterium sp. IB48]